MSLKLQQKPKQSSWTLAADDDELLDDEDLLTEEDKQRPVISGEALMRMRFFEHVHSAATEVHVILAYVS